MLERLALYVELYPWEVGKTMQGNFKGAMDLILR
jgi:hypothetical protein